MISIKTPKKRAIFTALALILLGVGACTHEDAQHGCKLQYSLSNEAAACIIGATQVGPQALGGIHEADMKCAELYGPKNIPLAASDGFEQASKKAEEYNACHFGAAAHLVKTANQDAGTVQADGCVEVIGRDGLAFCRKE